MKKFISMSSIKNEYNYQINLTPHLKSQQLISIISEGAYNKKDFTNGEHKIEIK